MIRNYSFIFALACMPTALLSCTEQTEEPNDVKEPIVAVDKLTNGGFEDALNSWNIEGNQDVLSIVDEACEGGKSLKIESESQYSVSLLQELNNIEDGYYDLEFFYKNSGEQDVCNVSVTSQDISKITSLRESEKTWSKGLVKGINVKGGKCQIKISVESENEGWTNFDSFALIKTNKAYNMLKGGDVSELTYIERMGGKFYENGEEKDCFDILQNNGFNIVRLRLYNDPGNPDFSPSNRLPAGVQDETAILALAKRAVEHNMQILLTFHYSDHWTNEEKPHEWKDLDFKTLKDSVYNFTYNFMTRMKEQGTTPQFVSLGNEVNAGFMFPDCEIEKSWTNFGEVINEGYRAIKEVSPDTKVVLHLSDAGNKDVYDWFFGSCAMYNINYDIIGASYYPFWSRKTIEQFTDWANYIHSKYNKDIIIMETGYNWNPTLPEGWNGQLSDNGPYQDIYASSPEGQKKFLLDLFSSMKNCDEGCVSTVMYWDPVMIEVEGVGWELGQDNVVSNTTLFDFKGNALKALDAFKYNN